MKRSCDPFREAISAVVDGEDPGVTEAALEAHLRTCAGCRTWAGRARELARATRVSPAASIPDLTDAVLAAARARGLVAPDPDAAPGGWRWALSLVALLQLGLAVPALVFGDDAGSSVHAARELGSWDVALAVGFLFAAVRPDRAWGMLPLVAALVGCMVVATGIDVASGRAELAHETVHGLAVVGLAVLRVLARRPGAPARAGLRAA